MMRIAMITAREGQLAAFRAGLEQHGFQVDCHASAWSFLESARTRRCSLVVLDGQRAPFQPALEQILAADASLNSAVLTGMSPETFHEAAEGLGVLCALPAEPGAGDVEALLARMRRVGALDPGVEAAQARLDAGKRRHHPHCVVCWDRHPFGLQVDYRVSGVDTVEGVFGCGKFHEGYENFIHGGVLSTLLDGAMASCMLARGLEAYTMELTIRFREAVLTGHPATIRGEWLSSAGPLHRLQATLEQDGRVRVRAQAKFLEGTPSVTPA